MVAAWAQLWDEDGNVILSGLEDPDAPVTLTELDAGAPAVRAVSNDYPNRSGSLDTSTFFGGRAVSLTFMCTSESDRRDLLSKVMPLIDPRRRPLLAVKVPEWGEDVWTLPLRADSFTAPLTFQQSVTTVWVNPTGVWESLSEYIAPVPGVQDIPSGRAYPRTYSYTYGTGLSSTSVVVTTTSPIATLPKTRLYGPVINPVITNQSTGQSVKFAYTVTTGHYLSIDCQAGTITEDDDPTISRFGKVDWSSSSFWALQPGDNLLAFTGTGFSSITQATVTWRERRI